MKTTGTFIAEDAFCITGRGWVLTGDYTGSISPGQQLVFATDTSLRIKAVNRPNIRNESEKIGLLLEATFESRQHLLELDILGVGATISD